MKNKEIKKLTKDQLAKKVSSLKKDLFNLRFRKINGQIENPAKFSDLKKEVARVMTNLNKKD
jgi:large subunit ribosomal protein L29